MTDHDSLARQILSAHGGVASSTQLYAAGLSHDTVARLLRGKVLVRVLRGWYATPDPQRTAIESHRLRALALLRLYDGRARPSHYTALVLRQVPVVFCDLSVAHMTRTANGTFRRYDRHVVHAADESTNAPVGPGPVGTAYAVVQTGLVSGTRAAVVAGDAALAAEACTREELAVAVAAYRRTSGIGQVSAAIGILDGRSESPGESLLRYDLWICGIPVVSQVEIAVGSTRYRADFRVHGTRVLIEFDGMGKYVDDPGALRREKVREERLRAAGWTVIRFVWSDLGHHDEIRHRIRSAIAASTWAS